MTKNYTDGFREARFWIGRVIIPAVMGAAMIVHASKANRTKKKWDEFKKTISKMKNMKEDKTLYYSEEHLNYMLYVIEQKRSGKLDENAWEYFKAEWLI